MAERKDNPTQYPGPEMFWRQSPELMDMQGDLARLWQELENLSRISDHELLLRTPGAIIGINQVNSQYKLYRLLELGHCPVEDPKYPNINILPREVDPRDVKTEPSIMVYLEKWPSGYRINGGPITTDYSNSIFVPKDKGEFLDVPRAVYRESVRQLTLKMMAKADRKAKG